MKNDSLKSLTKTSFYFITKLTWPNLFAFELYRYICSRITTIRFIVNRELQMGSTGFDSKSN